MIGALKGSVPESTSPPLSWLSLRSACLLRGRASWACLAPAASPGEVGGETEAPLGAIQEEWTVPRVWPNWKELRAEGQETWPQVRPERVFCPLWCLCCP